MSTGKRKVPIESSSDEDEEDAAGRAVAGSDSNWEDQDTSGDETKKLRIAIPKRKKVRKKKTPRSPRRGSAADPVNIPEEFLSECSKLFLDKRLDDKAARINWGRKQV